MTNRILINAPTEITIPETMGGTSPICWDDMQFWISRGGSAADVGGGRSEIANLRNYMPLAVVDRWCSLGSEVTEYDVYFEIDDPNKLCPFSEANPQESWANWGLGPGNGHAPINVDGKWYRSSRYGAAGERLLATEWYDYIAAPDTANTGIVRMLTVEDFQAIQQAANPGP